jgi:multisubunit Na+/H+ antiporter MnhE subunit
MVLLLVSNAIGLTPGTVVVELDEERSVFFVHVLHLHDIERVRRDLTELGALAVRAFASPLESNHTDLEVPR